MADLQDSKSSPKQAADRHQIFEQVALERLLANDDTNRPVEFLPLPVRVTLLGAAAITGLGIAWASLAKIPVQVYGQGAIVPSVPISSAFASVDGVLYYQVSGAGDQSLSRLAEDQNSQLETFWSESNLNYIRIQPYANLAQLARYAESTPEGVELKTPEALTGKEIIDNLAISTDYYRRLWYKPNTIVARIVNNLAIEELDSAVRTTKPKLRLDEAISKDRQARSTSYGDVGGLIRQQRIEQAKELRERERLFQRLTDLWAKGFVSTAQLLQEQSVLNSIKSQLLQSDRDSLNNSFNKVDQSQQAKQAQLNSLDLTSQLQQSLIGYMIKTFVISPPAGFYIISKNIRNGMEVRAGDEILTYSNQKPTLPSQIPVFVDSATSQQLQEGMSVLVTPKGISRAQFGGIPGKVVEVRKLPLRSEGLASYAGGRSLANTIQQTMGLSTFYLVRVELEQENKPFCQQMLSRFCYRWSGNRRPEVAVRLGTLADVQISTQYRRPVEFVMPALREALGLVVENR